MSMSLTKKLLMSQNQLWVSRQWNLLVKVNTQSMFYFKGGLPEYYPKKYEATHPPEIPYRDLTTKQEPVVPYNHYFPKYTTTYYKPTYKPLYKYEISYDKKEEPYKEETYEKKEEPYKEETYEKKEEPYKEETYEKKEEPYKEDTYEKEETYEKKEESYYKKK